MPVLRGALSSEESRHLGTLHLGTPSADDSPFLYEMEKAQQEMQAKMAKEMEKFSTGSGITAFAGLTTGAQASS